MIKRAVRAPAARLIELLLRWSSRPVGAALVYHRVGDAPGRADRDIVAATGTAQFERQLRHLLERYRPVRADQLVAAARARRRGERFPVCVTFDDDLASHAEVAAPLLRRLGVPATFYLSGASLAEPREFWWETLQRVQDRGGGASEPDGGSIGEEARRLRELPPVEQDRAHAALLAEAGPAPPTAGLRADAVRALVQWGFDIGFHTLRHRQLTTLDDAQLEGAMREGRHELEQLCGGSLTTIAYPHGRADSRVADAARAGGFAYGFTTSGAAVAADDDRLLLGRIDPLVESDAHFALQLARALARRARRA